MKRLKSVHISILTLLLFIIAILIGMQSNFWITEGRKTPLNMTSSEQSNIETDNGSVEEDHIEEEHETTEISGGSSVQDALNLGVSLEEIENILEGQINNKDELIKTIVTERGLKFGEVKDNLNLLINE